LEQQTQDDGNGRHDAVIIDLRGKGPHFHNVVEKDGILAGLAGLGGLEVVANNGELSISIGVIGDYIVENIFERLKACKSEESEELQPFF
jgi:hypothetical protein